MGRRKNNEQKEFLAWFTVGWFGLWVLSKVEIFVHVSDGNSVAGKGCRRTDVPDRDDSRGP